MKTPAHWSRDPESPGLIARLLAPFSTIWGLAADLRSRWVRTEIAPVPVLCIGNLIAGGSGKTPMAAALLQRLSARGVSAHIVSRGYGGRLKGPHLVDPSRDTVRDVGDEPLMLAANGPVWVARDRAAGARAAAGQGAQLILLDDGFQNPSLAKDASIVMVDAVAGFGNGRIIPAGPLREPIAEGLSRADLVVLVGEPEDRGRALARWPSLASAPRVDARLVPVQSGIIDRGDRVLAFAGIGYPEKFFSTLRALGADLIGTRAFPDHHSYAPQILRRMIADARAQDAMLMTTEKDAVRLPTAFRREVVTLMVQLEPDDWAPIDALIDQVQAKKHPRQIGG